MRRIACAIVGHRWWCANAGYRNTRPGCRALFVCKRCDRKARAIYDERYEIADMPKPSRWMRLPAPARFYPE
jgi:hypothetical protein